MRKLFVIGAAASFSMAGRLGMEKCRDNIIAARNCTKEEEKKQVAAPKVVTVNLDNECQVSRFQKRGIYLNKNDLLVLTGRVNHTAG